MKRDSWNKNDELYTPILLVDPILEFLKPNSTIWCPFDNETSEYVTILRKAGHDVLCSHIEDGFNFFNIEKSVIESWDLDYIISNPPFSTKLEVFERLYELDIPFAMLMNMTALQYHNIGEMFYKQQQDGKYTQILMFDKKVSFDGNTSMFNSSYVCYNVLPKDFIWYHLEHNNTKNNFVKSKMKLRGDIK